MDEYWRCESCGSKVRNSSARCFRCGSSRSLTFDPPPAAAGAAASRPAIELDEEAGVALASAAMSGRRYLPVSTLATTLAAVIVGLLLVDLVRFWSGAMLHGLDGRTVQALPNANDALASISSVAAVAEVIVGVMTISLWFFFLGVSLANAPALGAGTPGATWFDLIVDSLMPIRNLRRPHDDVADLYKRLEVPGATGTKIVGYWWAAVLLWFAIGYLPLFLTALELLVAVGVAIFIAFVSALSGIALFVNTQPHWTWGTPPLEMIEIVLLATILGPMSFMAGSTPLIAAFTVPDFGHSIPGASIVDTLVRALNSLGLVSEIVFVAILILMLRIVVELAERQRIRAEWLEQASSAAPLAAPQQ